MCGRFPQTASPQELAETFELDAPPPVTARFNVAPGQDIAIVRLDREGTHRELAQVRWGLVPFFSPEPKGGLINARAETVATKPAFREAFRRRRCLVPASGFYEWRREGKRRQPFLVRRRDGGLMAFGGVWERWKGAGAPSLHSCAIVTTAANALVQPIHDRMPVVVPRDAFALWLDREAQDETALKAVLAPPPADELVAIPVSTRVNDVKNDDAACLEEGRDEPPPEPRQKTLF